MDDWLNKCHFGDCVETMRSMPDGIAQTCVTSPPYFGLRDYGHEGQLGLEETPDEYIAAMVEVFRCVRDVLADDGTLWLNIGDSYAGSSQTGGNGSSSTLTKGGKVQAQYGQTHTHKRRASKGTPSRFGALADSPDGSSRVDVFGYSPAKPKDLIGIPWMLAFALRADGWYLRQDIIWHKPNPMPESVTDRCTKAHEYLFLLSKQAQYFMDPAGLKEPAVKGASGSTFNTGKTADHQLGRSSDSDRKEDGMRNRRSVWTVATTPYKGAHFATFPSELIEPCILAGAPAGGVVLDPFFGSGTTGQVAQNLGRRFIGCELNTDYAPLQSERLRQMGLTLEVV